MEKSNTIPSYNVSLLIISLEEMTEADNPEGVTSLDQVKLPCISTVARADEIVHSTSLASR